jgi:parallel beta-helix repeat protein
VDGASGSDAATGASQAQAWRTIGRAAAALQPGQTVCIAAGVYYESVEPARGGAPGAPITYRAADGAEGQVVISGAEALAPGAWVRDGADWRWDWQPGAAWPVNGQGFFGNNGNPDHGAPHVIRREMLVAQSGQPPTGASPHATFDGHVLMPVASRSALDAQFAMPEFGIYGTFWVDASGPAAAPAAIYARFYGDAAPAQARPLLAVRPHAFWPGGNLLCADAAQPGHIVLRGVVVRHTNNGEQVGAVCAGREGSTLDNVAVEFANGTGVTLGADPQRGGASNVYRALRVRYNGQMGASGVCNGCLLTDGEVAYNNWKGYHVRWEAGGLKLSWSERTVLRRMVAYENKGPGLWLDEANRDNVIEGCRALDNDDVGIFLELYSERTLVQHNVVARTRRTRADDMSGTGILTQTAGRNAIYWNTVVDNDGNGVFARADDRIYQNLPQFEDFTWDGLQTSYFNNLVAGNAQSAQGLYEDEAHEFQMMDFTTDWIRTLRWGGNRIMSHVGDSNGLQQTLTLGWEEPAPFYSASHDLDGFRSLLHLPQPDGTALLPYDEDAYAPYGDVTLDLPSLGAAVEIPAEAPCAGAACVVRCWPEVGANRLAIKGDFLSNPAAACVLGSTASEPPAPVAADRLRLAPNPVRGHGRVALSGLPGAPGETGRLEVFDGLGRRVGAVVETAGQAGAALDVQGWAPGVYLLRATAGRAAHTARLTVVR